MGNTLCGSVVVIAIPNAHTQDDATDSLSLRSNTITDPIPMGPMGQPIFILFYNLLS